MIPFFVVDRPVSLEILKGFFLKVPQKRFGILTHAFVSNNFKKKFRDFPWNVELKYFDEAVTESEEELSKRIIKFADSGIFIENRNISYEKLFEIYEELGVHYGVIIDHFGDKEKTIASAKQAISVYQKGKYTFKLVGVAQGKNLDDYMYCYTKLQDLGYEYIAIGGLLKRNGNSNYLVLKCETFLKELVEKIKEEFDCKWIFTFGIFNPKRKALLEELGIWGADYKGWLFHYDETYSFAYDYVKALNYPYKSNILFVSILLKHYKILKRSYKLSYSHKKIRNLIKLERSLLEKSLSLIGTSLQELRFRKVRDELYRIFK